MTTKPTPTVAQPAADCPTHNGEGGGPDECSCAAEQQAPVVEYVIPLAATPAMLDALEHAMPGQYKIGRKETKKIWDAVVKAAPFHAMPPAQPASSEPAALTAKEAERKHVYDGSQCWCGEYTPKVPHAPDHGERAAQVAPDTEAGLMEDDRPATPEEMSAAIRDLAAALKASEQRCRGLEALALEYRAALEAGANASLAQCVAREIPTTVHNIQLQQVEAKIARIDAAINSAKGGKPDPLEGYSGPEGEYGHTEGKP